MSLAVSDLINDTVSSFKVSTIPFQSRRPVTLSFILSPLPLPPHPATPPLRRIYFENNERAVRRACTTSTSARAHYSIVISFRRLSLPYTLLACLPPLRPAILSTFPRSVQIKTRETRLQMNSTRDREDTRDPSCLMFRHACILLTRDPIGRRAFLDQKEETRNEIVDIAKKAS